MTLPCDLGQVSSSLWALFSLSLKWDTRIRSSFRPLPTLTFHRMILINSTCQAPCRKLHMHFHFIEFPQQPYSFLRWAPRKVDDLPKVTWLIRSRASLPASEWRMCSSWLWCCFFRRLLSRYLLFCILPLVLSSVPVSPLRVECLKFYFLVILYLWRNYFLWLWGRRGMRRQILWRAWLPHVL